MILQIAFVPVVAVGVPDIVPEGLSESPEGKLQLAIDHV